MLPLGRLNLDSDNGRTAGNQTGFTPDEQVTFITLWCIFKSPLIFGGNLPDTDPQTLLLLTNADVLEMHRNCTNSREIARQGSGDQTVSLIWHAAGRDGVEYFALFNLSDASRAVTVALPAAGSARELWNQKNFTISSGRLAAVIPSHGARLFKIG